MKEDEYLRDGVTEDIITELSKIKGLKIFSRPTVLAYRDKPVTAGAGRPAARGRLRARPAACAGPAHRLRINAQLVDAETDFPLWSERYDREMADVFEVQDEIARKIAAGAAGHALAAGAGGARRQAHREPPGLRPLPPRARATRRRLTRQDLEFALQMFENAVALDPRSPSPTPPSPTSAPSTTSTSSARHGWIERAKAASQKASALSRELPEVQVAEAWILYAEGNYDAGDRGASAQAIERKPDAEGAYYLLGRALFAAGPVPGGRATSAEAGVEASRRGLQRLRADHQRARGARQEGRAATTCASGEIQVARGAPQERARGRARPHAAGRRLRRAWAMVDDGRCARRSLAMALRPNEAIVLYNAACVFCQLGKKAEALAALQEGVGRRLQGPRLGAPRPRPRAPPRRAGVRRAVPADRGGVSTKESSR